MRVLLYIFGLGCLLLVGLFAHRQYVLWRYMAPYRALVASEATESRFTAQQGKRCEVVTLDDDLRKIKEEFPPMSQLRRAVGSKVLVYPADPWGDGEGGFVVYIIVDQLGIAKQAVLGGH